MATYLPLRSGCTFHPFYNGSVARDYIVCTPDNRQFRISAAAYEILRELESGRSLEEIHASLGGEKSVSFSELHQLLITKYQAVLASTLGNESTASPGRRVKLLLQHTLIPQEIVARISDVLAAAWQPLIAVLCSALIVAAHLALYLRWMPGRGAHFHASLALLATFFSVVIHEFGHSSAVSRFGGRPGSIGVGLYVLLPVLYADVSQVWRFRQKQRVAVDLGGVYFQQIVFAMLALTAVLAHDPSLRAACISIDLMTIIALNPVFRFDGYWVLVDWLNLPNLHREAAEYLRQAAKSLIRLKWQSPQHTMVAHSFFRAAVFIFYAVAGNLLLIFLLFLNLRWIQATTRGLFKGAPLIWAQLQTALSHHQLFQAVDMLTSLLFLSASGFTVVCALWLRSRELLHLGAHHSATWPQPKAKSLKRRGTE